MTTTSTSPAATASTYDIAIVGGGPAGLSAALMAARSKRRIVLYDSKLYRNAQSKQSHTVPGYEGADPAQHRAILRADVEKGYPWVTFRDVQVTGVTAEAHPSVHEGDEGKLFRVVDETGHEVQVRRVVLATGLKDNLPPIPGLVETWGVRAIHCLFCHGTETANKPIAYLLTAETAMYNAKIAELAFKMWHTLDNTPVHFFTHGMDVSTPEGLAASGLASVMPLIKARGYNVVTQPIESITEKTDTLTVAFTDGSTRDVPYLVVFPALTAVSPHAQWIANLLPLAPNGMLPVAEGLPPLALPPRMGDDPRTAVPGVMWAGNAGSPMGNIALSMTQGEMAGAMAVAELGEEDFAKAKAAVSA